MLLTLYEEFLLLSIDDHRGQVTQSVKGAMRYGIAGATLAELALMERVKLKDKKLVLLDETLIGDDILDEALQQIAEAKKPRNASVWLNVLADKHVLKRIAHRLVEKEILHIEEKRYMWVIPYKSYPQKNASAKYWIKQRLRDIVLAEGTHDARTIIMLSLLNASQMLGLVFTKDERKAASKQVDFLVRDEGFGEVLSQTLDNIETATAQAILHGL